MSQHGVHVLECSAFVTHGGALEAAFALQFGEVAALHARAFLEARNLFDRSDSILPDTRQSSTYFSSQTPPKLLRGGVGGGGGSWDKSIDDESTIMEQASTERIPGDAQCDAERCKTNTNTAILSTMERWMLGFTHQPC